VKENKLRHELRMYFFLFMLYSFIGWIYETVLFSVREGKFINRGFNFGPYIPIYGFGAVVIMLAITFIVGDSCKIKGINVRPVAVFFVILILATTAELVGSYLIEKYLGVVLWDYHDEWLNFQGRIAPKPSLIFGFGGLAIFYIIQPLAKSLIEKLSIKGQRIFAIILLITIVTDFTFSLITTLYYPKVEKPGVMGKVKKEGSN